MTLDGLKLVVDVRKPDAVKLIVNFREPVAVYDILVDVFFFFFIVLLKRLEVYSQSGFFAGLFVIQDTLPERP